MMFTVVYISMVAESPVSPEGLDSEVLSEGFDVDSEVEVCSEEPLSVLFPHAAAENAITKPSTATSVVCKNFFINFLLEETNFLFYPLSREPDIDRPAREKNVLQNPGTPRRGGTGQSFMPLAKSPPMKNFTLIAVEMISGMPATRYIAYCTPCS